MGCEVHWQLKKGLSFVVEDRALERYCVTVALASPGFGSRFLNDARRLALVPGLATNVRFVPLHVFIGEWLNIGTC